MEISKMMFPNIVALENGYVKLYGDSVRTVSYLNKINIDKRVNEGFGMSNMSDSDWTDSFADADLEAEMVNGFLDALSHDIVKLAPNTMVFFNPELKQFVVKSSGRIKSRAAAKKLVRMIGHARYIDGEVVYTMAPLHDWEVTIDLSRNGLRDFVLMDGR